MNCLNCEGPLAEGEEICESCIYDEHYDEIHESKKAYYMGDLGYVIRDQKDWMGVVGTIYAGPKNPAYGRLPYKGGHLYIFDTVYGDGIYTAYYKGEMSHALMVDSGSIGVIPLSLLDGVTASDTTVIYLTDDEFDAVRCEDGVIYVGGYNINTN